MSAPPAIGQVMTPTPLTVGLTDTVAEAQRIMHAHQFRHLPVVDKGGPVGVVSDRDLHLALLATRGLDGAEQLTVEDVCTLQTYIVEPSTPLAEVVSTMAERHIGSVLVAEGGMLVGIFTTTDACRYLSRCLQGELAG